MWVALASVSARLFYRPPVEVKSPSSPPNPALSNMVGQGSTGFSTVTPPDIRRCSYQQLAL